MRKYRIITNGEKYKAQVRGFLRWGTLQHNVAKNHVVMRDVVYDTYAEAVESAIEYNRMNNQTWWPVN